MKRKSFLLGTTLLMALALTMLPSCKKQAPTQDAPADFDPRVWFTHSDNPFTIDNFTIMHATFILFGAGGTVHRNLLSVGD